MTTIYTRYVRYLERLFKIEVIAKDCDNTYCYLNTKINKCLLFQKKIKTISIAGQTRYLRCKDCLKNEVDKI